MNRLTRTERWALAAAIVIVIAISWATSVRS